MDNERLQRRITELENKLNTLEANYSKHQHDSLDGTNQLRKSIKLDQDQYLQVGLGGQGTGAMVDNGLSSEQLQYAISLGKDDGRTGFVKKADILQMDLLHQPRTATSFITARRTPLVSSLGGTSITTTSGGNTVTITGYNFTTNELAGGLINIYNSGRTLVESRVIASNTSTVVTITGTWGASTSGGSFDIYRPVYSGAAGTIWQRLYVQEGNAGGVRFGMGVTGGAQNQNGLLYMDAAGDLYWRDKAGTESKVFLSAATPLSGTKTYWVSDTNGGALDRMLTFTNGILTSE